MTESDLVDALGELGDTPEGVAENLRRAGCTGRRAEAHICPVAVWLKKRLAVRVAIVRRSTVFVERYANCHAKARLPNPVTQFVHRFDDGEFPDLRSPEKHRA